MHNLWRILIGSGNDEDSGIALIKEAGVVAWPNLSQMSWKFTEPFYTLQGSFLMKEARAKSEGKTA